MLTRIAKLSLFALLAFATACGDDDSGTDRSPDAGTDAVAPPPPPAATSCEDDSQCDDGVFCNGDERCEPKDPEADRTGCVPASAPACTPKQRCDEGADVCH